MTAVRGENQGATLLSSYAPTRGLKHLYNETKIWEACRATSAASTYFDPIEVGSFKEKFVDGGLKTNNPVKEVWLQARDLWGTDSADFQERVGCFVSIGTGISRNGYISNSLKDILSALQAIATETEDTAEDFERNNRVLHRDNRYFRWNVDMGMGDIGLDEYDRLNDIMAATAEYMKRERRHQEVTKCAGQLLNDECN